MASTYGLDKAFGVLFFNFVRLVITSKLKPNDLQNPPFRPFLRYLLTKLKTKKNAGAKYQELSKTVVRIVGWEPQHPAILTRDFQVFGKQKRRNKKKSTWLRSETGVVTMWAVFPTDHPTLGKVYLGAVGILEFFTSMDYMVSEQKKFGRNPKGQWTIAGSGWSGLLFVHPGFHVLFWSS